MDTTTKDLFSPRQFTKAWLTLNQVEVLSSGELRAPCKRKADQMLSAMWLDYCEQIKAHNAQEVAQKPYPRERKIAKSCTFKDLQMALEEFCDAVKLEARIKLVESLMCTRENLEPVRAFCNALGSKNESDFDVICHFIWSIKRKMCDRGVSNHIFPVLYSEKHGTGKSTAIERLLSPIVGHVIDANFQQISDERFSHALSESYVARIEELSGWSSKSEMEALKRVITGGTLTYRKLGTNSVFTVPNRASFIGSTNRRLNLIIVDRQNRRFHEIAIESIDWEMINRINYAELFQGIDENRSGGYLAGDSLSKLRKSQEQLATKPQVEEFFDEYEMYLPSNEKSKWLTADEIFKIYLLFAGASGINNKFNKQTLGRQLSNYGFKSKSKKVNGRTANCYEVNESCAIQSITTGQQGRF